MRERTAKFLAAFEPRWPTSAIDDRQRTAYAAAVLTETEQDEALAGIAPFIEMQQKAGRKAKIAGWRYLEEKRWQLLKAAPSQAAAPGNYLPTSREGRALRALYSIGRIEDLFFATVQRQGVVWWRGEIAPQALALAEAPPAAQWVKLSHQQAGAWEALLQRLIKVQSRRRLVAGDVAPWPWPPRVDGSLAAEGGADPPQPEMTADDEDALAREGGRG